MASLLVVLFAAAQLGQARFGYSASEIARGDSVVLSWVVPGADSVFITGLGVLGPTGRRTLHPERSDTLFLVAPDRDGRRVILHAEIRVSGSKGGDDNPNAAAFVVRESFHVAGPDLFQLLHRVSDVLQRDFSYSAPDWTMQPTGVWVATTELKERYDMVLRQETRIALRRVGYRITINPSPGEPKQFQCVIASVVQFRNRIERSFYPEQSDTLYHQQIARLGRGLGWSK